MAAGAAEIVRQLQFAAIRAFLIVDGRQRVVAATHVALGRRCFSLGEGHAGTCSSFSTIGFGRQGNQEKRPIRPQPWRPRDRSFAVLPIAKFLYVSTPAPPLKNAGAA